MTRHFRRWIDALTVEADRTEFADPAFRRELSYWIGQGVFGSSRLMAGLEGMVVSHVDLGEPVARQDHDILESASLLGLDLRLGRQPPAARPDRPAVRAALAHGHLGGRQPSSDEPDDAPPGASGRRRGAATLQRAGCRSTCSGWDSPPETMSGTHHVAGWKTCWSKSTTHGFFIFSS